MFYRGFDGPLLRQRFLEGNDTHEIKLILAVSRNANAQEQNFTMGGKGCSQDWVSEVDEGRGHRKGGTEELQATGGGLLRECSVGEVCHLVDQECRPVPFHSP